MEPTNHPFRKENDLPNPHDYVLQGCNAGFPNPDFFRGIFGGHETLIFSPPFKGDL